MKELFQSGDWAKEKHVPVIEILDADSGEGVSVKVSIGKEIAHPNTTAHHIVWMELFFQPDGGKFPYQVALIEFNAHGASTEGADTSTVYSNPEATVRFKTEKSGTVYASSCCNIHGLWENSERLEV